MGEIFSRKQISNLTILSALAILFMFGMKNPSEKWFFLGIGLYVINTIWLLLIYKYDGSGQEFNFYSYDTFIFHVMLLWISIPAYIVIRILFARTRA